MTDRPWLCPERELKNRLVKNRDVSIINLLAMGYGGDFPDFQ
jgi:hypothetical protein